MLRWLIPFVIAATGATAQSVDFDETADPALVATIESCLDRHHFDARSALTCLDVASKPCLDTPGNDTTFAMRACTSNSHLAWDALLNARYATLRRRLPEAHFAILRDAQRAWITFRDAECALAGKIAEGGTLEPLLVGQCYNYMTAIRAVDLDQLVRAREAY